MPRQAVGPPSLLLEGYRVSSVGVKWLGHGAVPLLPHYAFMVWVRQLSLIQDSTVEEAVMSHVCSNDVLGPVSETAFQACFMSLVLSNLVQSVGVCTCYVAHIISCGFIVYSIPHLVAAAFVGRGVLLPLLMFLTLRGLMLT